MKPSPRAKQANHKIETFFGIAVERTTAFHQRRVISPLTRITGERHDVFLEIYPSVAQRLPQYALASYLGMPTEFLFAIHNQKTRKKS